MQQTASYSSKMKKPTKTVLGRPRKWYDALPKLRNPSYIFQYVPQQISKDLKLDAWIGDKYLSSATATVIAEDLCSVVTDSHAATQLENRALSNNFLAMHAPSILMAPDLVEWGGSHKAEWELGTLVEATVKQIMEETNDRDAIQDLARWLLLGTVREGQGRFLKNVDCRDVTVLLEQLLLPEADTTSKAVL